MDDRFKAFECLQAVARRIGRQGALEIDSRDADLLQALTPRDLIGLGFSRALANDIGYALMDGDLRPLGRFFQIALSPRRGALPLASAAGGAERDRARGEESPVHAEVVTHGGTPVGR